MQTSGVPVSVEDHQQHRCGQSHHPWDLGDISVDK